MDHTSPGPRQDLPRWHSVASGITRPILWLRKAFDVLILLLVFAVPACYLSMSTSSPFF